ncbi:MAG: UDP-N-acetylmuramoyl-L-alanine--D-glutamate ligase [Candidatus Cryptobacteroides sp.]
MSRIVVLGGAESGIGAAILAKVKGFDVFLSDKGKIEYKYIEMLKEWEIPFEQGQHSEELILNADEIIKSPGIPTDAPMIRKIISKGIHIISEIEFAGRYDKSKKICITGSNGKTTTTSLIYYLLQQAGLNVGIGGNIGKSYAYQVATENFDYYVLEISSFQLDNCYDFRPDIAIITNITPDHLDRYEYNIENYVRAKFRIIRNLRPEDCFIFDSDDEITINHLSRIITQAKKLPFTQKGEVKQGAFLKDEKIVVRYEKDECDIYLQELALGGKHNIYNSMAAALAAKATGIDNRTIRASLETFQPIEHRLEPVLSVKGVLYINDSKATNVDAAWYALECQTKPVVWIVGGTDKGNDYHVLEELVKKKVKAIVCLGLDNHKLHEAFEKIVGKDNIIDTKSADEAVKAASRFANDGDVVLLSPCCASFDLFTCYEDRGEKFKEAVRNL